MLFFSLLEAVNAMVERFQSYFFCFLKSEEFYQTFLMIVLKIILNVPVEHLDQNTKLGVKNSNILQNAPQKYFNGSSTVLGASSYPAVSAAVTI